jgi:formylglycine-generating enzyme required for sulfatase activity
MMNRILRIAVIAWGLLIGLAWGETFQVSGKIDLAIDGTPAAGVRVNLFDLTDLRHSFSTMTDAEGNFIFTLESPSAALPSTFQLLQNFPNPFNPSTTIPYELGTASHVRLEIFNALGQRVRTLIDEVRPAGQQTAHWDARNEQGQGVAAGVYIYRLTSEGSSLSRQMVLLDGKKGSTGSPQRGNFETGSSSLEAPVSRVYGLTISGAEIATFVQSELIVGPDMRPLRFTVEAHDAQGSAKPTATAARALGDVDNDGQVTLADALIVATYGLDNVISIPNNGDISLGDVNGDERVDVSDALIIATFNLDPINPALPEGIGQPVEEASSGEVADTTFVLPGDMEMQFVWIEPETFMMGSPETETGRYSNEGPQHEVTLTDGFYLGTHEVTQEQWEAVMGTTPWAGRIYVEANPDHPAVWMTWNDVQEFVKTLNASAGGLLYRLPTEAEWEYACRAGTTTRWSFGDDESQLGDYAWYYSNAWGLGEKYGHKVGTKLPNPWGLYDMHGNMWEWVADWYGDYSSDNQIDPTGPTTGAQRCLRSGRYYEAGRPPRSAERASRDPESGDASLGLRLLRQAVASPAPMHDLSGQVMESGQGLADVTLALSGAATAISVTSANGTYTFPDLADGSYTIKPSQEGYTFTPDSLTVTVSGADIADLNFSRIQALTATLPGDVTMEFMKIEPGTFMMGSPETEADRFDNEGPQHEVTITSGFYLGKYEVTQAQWQAVMGTTPWSGSTNVQEKPDNPAVNVSWDNIQTFVQRLNEAAESEMYRLPTEAEWEYACRAGTTTPWPFGEDENLIGNYAWYGDNSRFAGEDYAHTAGMKLPNPWGLYDMHGNVWEWCQDRYGTYPSDIQTDPTGSTTGSNRILRGGSFFEEAVSMRSAYRHNDRPSLRKWNIGFRLLKVAEVQSVQAQETIFFHSYRPDPSYVWGKYDLYRINPDGTGETRLIDDAYSRGFPAVSPDGNQLAYVKWQADFKKFWICVANIDAANEQDIFETSNNIVSLSWFPDGTKLLMTQRNNKPNNGDTRDGDIFTLNIDGTDLVNLTNEWDHQKHYASLSPDGTQICYNRNGTGWFAFPQDLLIMNSDGSSPKSVTSHGSGGENQVWRCVFSPDGKTILYSKAGLWKLDLGTMEYQALSNLESNAYDPHYKSDGSKIVFTRKVGDYYQIATANSDGTDIQIITQSDFTKGHPFWVSR